MSTNLASEQEVRLLPRALESSARGIALRAGACALLAVAVLSWIGLLSWTANDSGLRAESGRHIHNLLGPFGAASTDFLVQTLGVATIFALTGPMIWGLEMLAEMRPIAGFRNKAIAFPLGVLLLAGALSGLPTLSLWPLHNGYGGMLGDLVNNMLAMAVLGFSPEHAGRLASIVLGFIGTATFVYSLGLPTRHLIGLLPKRTAATAPAVAEPAEIAAAPEERHEPVLDTSALVDPPAAPLADSDLVAERGDDFDRETDALAGAVAERFAPGNAKAKSGARARRQASDRATEPMLPALDELDAPTSALVTAQPTSGTATKFAPTSARPRNAASGDDGWTRPRFDLLTGPDADRPSMADRLLAGDRNAGLVVDALADFGVQGVIRGIKPGPVVTRYEFEPARGVKTSRVVSLADDIARSLGAHSVRVAVIPGRNAIGIEVPNPMRETVRLREIIETETFMASPAHLPLALGKGIGGEIVVADLARMPHLLIAGTTGSGKSVGINTMILSLIWRLDPTQCRLLLIDPKMLELAHYNGVPHLLAPVVTDAKAAADALEWAVAEMERRYTAMAKVGVRNLEAYNARVSQSKSRGHGMVRTVQTGFDPITGKPVFEHEHLDSEPLPYIVVVVDEFADLMMTAGDRVEAAVQRLAQMARAAGIHLIMATQRPSVDVVTGTIKANFPMRLSFRVASRVDSRTILGEAGAETLLGHGDMLMSVGSGQPLRIHGALVTDEEVVAVTDSQRSQAAPKSKSGGRPDPYDDAVAAVLADRKANPGYLARRLGVPEAVALRFIERMETDGYVGPADALGRRKVLAQPVADEEIA